MDEIRLGLAAVEFNISKDLIVDILQNNGFDIENKPTAKLNQEMYNFVSNYLASDKIFNAEEIEQSKNKRFIGLVKWFHDKAKNSNYGFIQHVKLGDLFFHEKSIKQGQNLNNFQENEIVTFFVKSNDKKINIRSSDFEDIPTIVSLSRSDKKHEAINVMLLSNENNLSFLFDNYLSILTEEVKFTDYKLIQKAIHLRIKILLEQNQNDNINHNLFNQFQDFISIQLKTNLNKDVDFIIGLFNICKTFFSERYLTISKIIELEISEYISHKLWLDGFIETCQVNYISDNLMKLDLQSRNIIIQKCNFDNQKNIFNKILDKFSFIDNKEKFEQIIKVKDFFKNINSEIDVFILKRIKDIINYSIEKGTDVELSHLFWLEKYSSVCQISYIASFIIDTEEQNQRKIFSLCSSEDKINIFFKIIKDLEEGSKKLEINFLKQILTTCKSLAQDHYQSILKELLRICPVYIRLLLWLEDFHQNLEFYEFKTFTISMSTSDQKKFVKKVLKYIHEDKVKISIEELTSINTIDYDTSKLIEAFDNSKLDYSTSIILNTISELNSQIVLEKRSQLYEAKKRIFDLILNQIKDPTDILEVKGFFDECEGRCSVQISKFTDDKGVVLDSVISYKRNQNQKAKLHPICDGRKATMKGTNNPILDENGVQFWWCANQKCYEPSRKLHNSSEWEKYTLLDFLTILKIPFKEKDLEIYLSLINKANRFLKHLKCRECNHILKPKDKSNYAFWGINYFQCNNETCSQKGKEIYLTHCLNGKCEMEIDSRDSVKCKPDGFDSDKCGWYVCNYCHSCCSDEVIQRRMDILKRTGQEYKCQTMGHRNLGVFSCNKCGNSMNFSQISSQNYKDALKWFIENKDKSRYIINSGIYKTKHWFVFAKSDLSREDYLLRLNNLSRLGFRIPDFEEDKNIQLISEPNDIKNSEKDILICSVCDNTLILTNEIERTTAIKSFHNVLFVKEKV
jgi:cold shock CspA family protein